MTRHSRQIRLAEVGAAGQARIVAATVEVPMLGLPADVASRYLAGAGVGRLRVRSAAIAAAASAIDPSVRVEIEDARAPKGANDERCLAPSGESSLDLRDPVARDLALGARAALRVLRAVLEGAS